MQDKHLCEYVCVCGSARVASDSQLSADSHSDTDTGAYEFGVQTSDLGLRTAHRGPSTSDRGSEGNQDPDPDSDSLSDEDLDPDSESHSDPNRVTTE